MTNEIKEILNRFDFVKKEPNKLSYYPEDLLAREEMWLLYDYITNLQEEIQKKDAYIKYLNERTTIQGKVFYGDAREVLQERIDKAIEYIKDKARNNCWIDQFEANDLIKILQGEDK